MFSSLQKPYLIAEISGNHNGSIERAKQIIAAAKNNGADCVKLQTYTPDTMTIKSSIEDFQIKGGLWDGYQLWDLYNWAHTPYEWHPDLFAYAKSIGITCISTPFDETAVDLLEDLNTPFYKIASFELTDLPLIKYIAQTKKPIIASTGMANLEEIQQAVNVIREYGGGELALLHCVSGYPTPIEQINLSTIPLLQETFKCSVGLSDHTLDNLAATLSIGFGAMIIEKHFTLARSDGGPDANFSMEPKDLNHLAQSLQRAFLAKGKASFNQKKVEEANNQFRRSIYVVKNIKKGEYFTSENIRRIRPGFGLSPQYYEKVLGTIATADLQCGTALKIEHTELNP
ncbi:pseudaminic acid synthase [Terasakiella brassicae]|uniref:Pseudaminic acid synthase n=1 Tax=Terasakiella brassicae TaxID=1634917 RepID=A0A917F9X3_9PROT|nr:pseudaminic acid synthase [Terasakiella brassicae]GGF56335.1 pseudaminic acid synthase [Terasakiella brassicae]